MTTSPDLLQAAKKLLEACKELSEADIPVSLQLPLVSLAEAIAEAEGR